MADWEIPTDEKSNAVVRALANPDRRLIFEVLAKGPLRQIRLAERLGMQTGKRYSDSALLYHLKPLEAAGLIERFSAGEGRYVRRALDVRVMIKRRPKERLPAGAGRVPLTKDELKVELRKIAERRRRR